MSIEEYLNISLNKEVEIKDIETSLSSLYSNIDDKIKEQKLLSDLQKMIANYINIDDKYPKSLNEIGSIILTYPKFWILLISSSLLKFSTKYEIQKCFFDLINNSTLYNIQGRGLLKNFYMEKCKELFDDDLAIKIINSNPKKLNKLDKKVNKKIIEENYIYFLSNPFYFDSNIAQFEIKLKNKLYSNNEEDEYNEKNQNLKRITKSFSFISKNEIDTNKQYDLANKMRSIFDTYLQQQEIKHYLNIGINTEEEIENDNKNNQKSIIIPQKEIWIQFNGDSKTKKKKNSNKKINKENTYNLQSKEISFTISDNFEYEKQKKISKDNKEKTNKKENKKKKTAKNTENLKNQEKIAKKLGGLEKTHNKNEITLEDLPVTQVELTDLEIEQVIHELKNKPEKINTKSTKPSSITKVKKPIKNKRVDINESVKAETSSLNEEEIDSNLLSSLNEEEKSLLEIDPRDFLNEEENLELERLMEEHEKLEKNKKLFTM